MQQAIFCTVTNILPQIMEIATRFILPDAETFLFITFYTSTSVQPGGGVRMAWV